MDLAATGVKSGEARSLRFALAASVPVTGLLMAAYYYGGIQGVPDETPLRATAVCTAAAAVVALLLWRWCRNAGTERTAWLGALAVVSLAGFWLGVFAPVCVTAVLFGRRAIAAARARAGWFAVAAGGLVALAGTVLCLLGAS